MMRKDLCTFHKVTRPVTCQQCINGPEYSSKGRCYITDVGSEPAAARCRATAHASRAAHAQE